MNQAATGTGAVLPLGLDDSSRRQPYFFTPSTLKLALMAICTLGIYELYWFYKNWVLIKARTGQEMIPFWRAFFAPLWAYSCFKHVRLAAQENQVSSPSPIVLLAVAYFTLNLFARLPDPYWLISFLSFATIIPVNTAAHAVNRQIHAENFENSRFSAWNWVGLVLGGLCLLVVVIGTFLPEG